MVWMLGFGLALGIVTYLVLLGSVARSRHSGRLPCQRFEQRAEQRFQRSFELMSSPAESSPGSPRPPAPRARRTDVALVAQLSLYNVDTGER
ncbi:MAG TPA: hypothetical protein VIJ41_13175 [Candidatus Nanopelagicales bacterium]